VFTRDAAADVRHFCAAHPMPDDIDRHSVDLLSSVWHLMDLTPEGRDDWYADVSYHERNVLAQ
jgi:predicted dithiol-disulfide oxidoreductase (DUF899 family)